jgi:uncharacterized membrane protein YfcA
MEFTLAHYAVVSLILLASSVVQGAVGFAAGLFGIPLLVLCGVTFPDAVAISLVAAAPQNIIPTWQLRRDIDFRRALKPILIRFATLPIGVAALWFIGQTSKDLASQIVGVIVLIIVAVQRLWRIEPQPRLHAAWEWLAFGLAGFLLGLSGMGGPPMVLWVLAHDWPMNQARGFLYFIFSVGLIPQGVLMWLFFGNEVLGAMVISAASFPAIMVGLWLGLAIGRAVPDRALRTASLSVLILIAASAIISPYFKKERRDERDVNDSQGVLDDAGTGRAVHVDGRGG